MSIASEITRIKDQVTSSYTQISSKGGTIPSTANTGNLATAINSIQAAGDLWGKDWVYAYAVNISYTGTGTVSGGGVFISGESATVVATAGSGFGFDGWYNGSTKVSSSTSYTFTVTANVSLYAKFAKIYTITVKAGSNGTVSGGGSVAAGGSVQISATANSGYQFKEWNDGNTSNPRTISNVQANATYTATFEQTPSCLVAGTLINMPDGTKKSVEEIVNWSELLSWDFEQGKPAVTPVTPMDKCIIPREYDVIYLNFDDGKRIGYVDEHWFFSRNSMEFVEFNRDNPETYIGQEFVKVDGDSWTTNTLISVERTKEVTTVYSPVNFKYMNIIADDMLNMAADLKGMFNYFEVNPETMAWYPDKKLEDIEKYGLMTKEEMGGELDQDAMDAFSVQYLKVSMAKGLINWDKIRYYINRYLPNLYMNE